MKRLAAAALALAVVGAPALVGCAGGGAQLRDPTGPPVQVPPGEALAFHQRAELFYARLLARRFNTLDTFNDPVLREHFRSLDLFFDYYADLAQSLAAAHFEKSRPEGVEIREFVFDAPDEARILVRFEGADGRPLRPDRTALTRVDRWVRAEGSWWVSPDKL